MSYCSILLLSGFHIRLPMCCLPEQPFVLRFDQVMVIRIDASKPGSINNYFQLEGVTNPTGTLDEKWGIFPGVIIHYY